MGDIFRGKTLRVVIGCAVLLAVVLAFSLGRGCGSCSCGSCGRPFPKPVGIDAGPGEAEIAAQLAASERQAQAEIAKINAARDREIAAFTVAQESEYRAVAAQGPEALSVWFSDFNRSLRDGGK